ncbi:hypothetical protein ETD86_45875 [Nonomuraea turkmeniaca]|uniref:Uncharacterized protein n=1 Tax=Nonomuraea turkmeniaca TaxID=103838 RepID=A0A5S4EZE9_9ACTN|nr:hypothetical protein [Nonomuraea turkmeniaca]TMR08905.1 hypothetical protein ETD86_45875 [Nonomuraea turkmeniaca]
MFTRADLDYANQEMLAAIANSVSLRFITEADRMLALVNKIRTERNLEPAQLSQVVALHEKTANLPVPGRAYALQCALLALNPSHA